MQNYARIGIFGILALVLLRVGIGWHFYMEGVAKVRGNDFTSEGFLTAARGPLADQYQNLIWDKDGTLRLDQKRIEGLFQDYSDRAASHFALTAEQEKNLARLTKLYRTKLSDVYGEADEAIFKYSQSVDRLKAMKDSPMWNKVASLRGQRESIEKERMAAVQPTISAVDAIWRQFEGRVNNFIATTEQRQSSRYFYFKRPGEGLMTTRVVDQIIPIFDMSVGILLMLGLLTPLAAWAAALFLISVVLSQMPGYPGTQPTYFQAVERWPSSYWLPRMLDATRDWTLSHGRGGRKEKGQGGFGHVE
ncbi:MAG: hypothetical protein R3C53_12060 [Pirellulaceae bacterium]